jgi:hypothetical protein
VSTEDRVRAAGRARMGLIGDIRPLELPAEPPEYVRKQRNTSRWLSWGAPIAAAVLVTALALTLALLRQAGGPQPGPVTQTPDTSAGLAVPRYYVALTRTGSTGAQSKAVVGDDRVGRRIAVINPSAGQSFDGVTAAADDRTFVLMNYEAAKQQTTWYLLRIAPGAVHPAQLMKLPIKPLGAHVNGLALSPDGRELAVMFRTANAAAKATSQLSVYSVSSGALQASWNTSAVAVNNTWIGGEPNSEGLSWVNGDRRIDFRWFISPPGHPKSLNATVRTLDVTSAGHDLLADSRQVIQVPASIIQGSTFTNPCAASLAARDGTVICGSDGGPYGSGVAACPAASPTFVSYPAATGKPRQVLYRYEGQCRIGTADVLWTDPSASHIIGLFLLNTNGKRGDHLVGVADGGHFTRLPALVVPLGVVDDPGGIAF